MGFLHLVLILYVLCIPLCKTKTLAFLSVHFKDLRIGGRQQHWGGGIRQ